MNRPASELLDLYEPGGCGLVGHDRFNFDVVMLTHALDAARPASKKSAKDRVAATLRTPSSKALLASWEARNNG